MSQVNLSKLNLNDNTPTNVSAEVNLQNINQENIPVITHPDVNTPESYGYFSLITNYLSGNNMYIFIGIILIGILYYLY